jgi:hypothetical protein
MQHHKQPALLSGCSGRSVSGNGNWFRFCHGKLLPRIVHRCHYKLSKGKNKGGQSLVYYFLRGRLAKTEDDSLDCVARTQRKIVSVDGKKIAAYHDARGKLTLLSPACTQLKRIVRWNDAAKTGELFSGPAAVGNNS